MVQAKDAIPGMTPGAIVPQSDQDVEPGFTPKGIPAAGPPVANVQAKPTLHGTEDDRAGLSNWAPELNKLYDTKTGQPVRLEYKDLHTKLMEGSVGFKKGESIPMITQNGESWNIPAENVVAAIQQGYRVEHPHEIAVREFKTENEGLSGSAKAFLTNFADEALFGVPGIVYKYESTDLERAKLQALKDQHAIANATGGIAGFGASMLYGGELFQTATKGGRVAERLVLGAAEKAAVKEGEELAIKALAQKMAEAGVEKAAAEKLAPGLFRQTAANMAKWGVEGAIINAPKEITEAVYDPKAAGEHLLYTIGAGAALGAVTGPLGGKFVGMSKELANKFPEVFAELKPGSVVARAAGAERGTTLKYGRDTLENHGKLLLEQKLLEDGEAVINGPMHFHKLKDRVGIFKKEAGEEIGSILKQLEEKSRPADITAPVDAATIAAERAAGDKAATASAYRPDIGKILAELSEMREKLLEPIYKKELKEIDRIIATVEKRADGPGAEQFFGRTEAGTLYSSVSIDFMEAQKLKEMIGDLAKWDHRAKGKINEVRQDAYRAVRDGLDSAVIEVSEKLDMDLAKRYMQAKENYKAASDISDLINIKDSRSQGNRIFGLTDSIMSGASGAAGMVGSILSGNFIPMLFPVLTYAGKKALESTWLQTGFARFMADKGLDKAGLLFTEQAMRYGAKQLDRLPEIIQHSVGKVTPSTFTLSAVSRFIGRPNDPKTPEERQKAFKDLAAKLDSMILSPDKTANQLGNLSAPLTFGAPKISQAYIQQTMRTYEYLKSILPTSNKDMNPFKKNISQLSDKQMADFERALRIVENPWNIIESFQNNTMTQSQVDVLKNIYPTVYSAMQQKIAEFAYSGKASELPYDTRLKLSLLMGIKLDQSIMDVSAYQANFAKPSAKPQAGSKVDIITPKMNPYQTPIQKLMVK
jgi:hypothetical protein